MAIQNLSVALIVLAVRLTEPGWITMATVTLSSKGQLVIPKAMRKRAQLEAGDVFAVSLVAGEIRLKPVAPATVTTLDQVAGCLARPGRKRLTDAQAKAAIGARLKSRHTAA